MSAALQIKRLSAREPDIARRWDEFVFACPQATFFHRAGWLRLVEDVFKHQGYFLYAEREGQIEGVLPLAQVKSRLFGHALVGLPFAVYGGVAASSEDAADALEKEAQVIAQRIRAEHLELRNTAPRHADWPRQDLYVTFRKEIFAEEEANMLAIPRKARAMVRKGIKNELVSQIDPNVDRFFDLYADNVHRHGTPAMPKRYFEELLREFGADAEVMTVSDAKGQPLSSVLSFYFRDEVLPYYAGDDESARHLAANDFKYWELMRRSCARGLKVFDYGRSKQGTGSFAFKKNWGFEPTPLYYEYCLYKRDALPQNNPNNPKYQLMIKTWRRLPIGVANWLGPFIVRSLGVSRVANILYLVHRLPYPPNKGDKVRSYHLLKHLAARHRVFLGSFVDDADDWQYVDYLRSLCVDVHAAALQPRRAKIGSLRGLLGGEALSLPYYRDAGLSRWVRDTAAAHKIDAVVVFSSPMAQYAEALPALPLLVDFVDVDSAKWTDYASAHAWPLSWLYRREGRELLAFEQAVAERARCSFFVTDKEVALFRQLSPALNAEVEALSNGVDADFFSPDPTRASPFPAGQMPLVFTGAMDYWPNADAVIWFATEVLPKLRERLPALHFHIVGRSPTPAVQALAGEAISVTGTVPDVRPYLQHAAAVVAPLRLARGIQNKILEAMAMGRPVVAASSCVQAIEAQEGQDLLAAETPDDYVRKLSALLVAPEHAARIGAAGRARVVGGYSWQAHLAGIDRHLDVLTQEPVAA